MRRRDFIAGSAGAAFASSAKRASAQAVGGLKRIGVLVEYEQHDAEARSRLSAFRDGLESLGWIDGRTVLIEYRFGGGDPARIRTFATELAALKPDVMLGSGAPVTGALREVTRTIPIVFVQASDPVGAGLVASLGRPGGNITGFTNFEYAMVGKWLETTEGHGSVHYTSSGSTESGELRLARLHESARSRSTAAWCRGYPRCCARRCRH